MRCLRNYHTEIVSITSVFTVVVLTGGFALTWKQLSNTTEALQAANTYQIQKDSREIISDISQNGNIDKYISGEKTNEIKENAKLDIWRMNNFLPISISAVNS